MVHDIDKSEKNGIDDSSNSSSSTAADYYRQAAFRYDVMYRHLSHVLELFGKETEDKVFRALEESGIFLRCAEDDDNYYKEKRDQQFYTIEQVRQALKEIFGIDGADLIVTYFTKLLKKDGQQKQLAH